MKMGRLQLNKFIKQIFIALFCLIALSLQNAFASTLSAEELNKIVFNKINSETKKELGNVEYKINLHGSLSDVSTNDSGALKVEISPLEHFSAVSYRRISIKNSKGNIVKTFPLNVQIQIYKEVLVAADSIPFGKNIDSTNTKFEKREVSKIYDKIISQMPTDSIASRNIIKGNIIQKNSIKHKAIIGKNQNVDIVFKGKSIVITLRGKALNEGALGDTILVKSEKYNKTYSATIDSNSKVTVRI